MHGVMMVFFFLIPAIPAVLGNFLLPLMIGAKDLAFPGSTSRAGTSTTSASRSRSMASRLAASTRGGRSTFRTAPSGRRPTSSRLAWACSSSGSRRILTGLNFLVTIHRMRAPGLTWFRLPLFIWAHYATSLWSSGARHPVAAITVIVLRGAERIFSFGLFNPRWAATRCSSSTCSGSYLHPAVYIMIPAGHGASSSRRSPGMTRAVRLSLRRFLEPGIGSIGFSVWGKYHVRGRHVGLRQARVLGADLHRRYPVRRQGVQLDGHDG